MIGIDMLAWFVPSFMESDKYTPEERRALKVRGTIIYVNYAHKYFTVEYKWKGETFKESFSFSDCGKTVHVRG